MEWGDSKTPSSAQDAEAGPWTSLRVPLGQLCPLPGTLQASYAAPLNSESINHQAAVAKFPNLSASQGAWAYYLSRSLNTPGD